MQYLWHYLRISVSIIAIMKIYKCTFLLTLFILINSGLWAEERNTKLSWPIEIELKGNNIVTLYQPQLESFQSNILEGRMAVTIKPDNKDLLFGAIWFKARMSTDMDTRIVVLEEIDIIKTHFPDVVDEEKTKKLSELLEDEIELLDLHMSLDRIIAGLDEVENLAELSDQINNDPPEIYYREIPAVLVIVDGDPILKKDQESGLEYVVNTPFFMVKDSKSSLYFINGGNFWYSSKQQTNGYMETKDIPKNVKKFAEKSRVGAEKDSLADTYNTAPELIVSTKAAELILVDGKPDYKPIKGTDLLYVSNSESDILMDINTQAHYLLLAGRWYYAKSLDSKDWKFQEPDDLPEDFRKIPTDSDIANVRTNVPGTDEAQTAVLEQSIPQTATIDRKEAKVEVKYDGEPKFEKITGTDMSYAVNTDKSVLLIDNVYYVVDNAVWFSSKSPTGPWEVSVEKPEEVNDIPPESPVYNVKYTYVYDYTPNVVYVGYLPGYTNCYVYNGVVVYGTGYYYQPWYGAYYYPRPVTWGFGVHYNPWTGWGFSFGVSYGWISWSIHPYSRAYWGPRGYHHGYRHGYNHGYHRGYGHGYRAGYAAGQRSSNQNIYKNRSNGVRQTADMSNRRSSINNRARTSNKANNIYTDRSGNVYQRNNQGSFDRKNATPSQRPNIDNSNRTRQQPANRQQPQTREQVNRQQPNNRQQPTTRQQPQNNNRQQLDRSYQNRNQGNQNFNRSQQQMQRSIPSGGNRSTGGRRR